MLHDFLRRFWSDPQNRSVPRQAEGATSRRGSGELFIMLHTNPVDGMSYVRLPLRRASTGWRYPGTTSGRSLYHEAVPGDLDWLAGCVVGRGK